MDSMDVDDIEVDFETPPPFLESAIPDSPLTTEEPTQPTLPLAFDAPSATKLHIRGLDELSTNDLTAYASQYFQQTPRIEWIDDTSANLDFGTFDSALDALETLSAEPFLARPLNLSEASENTQDAIASTMQLRTAKPLSSRPDVALHVRMALQDDRKKPRAHEASRFYLMHPEHDPRSTRNGREGRRPRRPRSRSASPGRADRDDSRRRRRRTPPPAYSQDDRNPIPRGNLGKKLFPVKTASNRKVAANLKKELFPNGIGAEKQSSALRNGSDKALNITNGDEADKTADLFGKRMPVPFVDGATSPDFPLHSDSVPRRRAAPTSEGFAIKGGGARNGNSDGGFRIRGAAASDEADQGFAIRGAAVESARNREATEKKVKELFPDRVENRGKELFIRGRAGGARKKADTFF